MDTSESFIHKLESAQDTNSSLLCIGLDPDFEKIPEQYKKEKRPQYSFNKYIVDQTHDLVCAYKPNSAFYEARGADGIQELKMTCDYIREKYPAIPIILDAKRADIGNTNNGYVQFAFDYLQVDAITLHPYLGKEALAPFLERKDKGCLILCKTSNPGSGEFQDSTLSRLNLDQGLTLWAHVAHQVENEWNKNNNCLLVVGATYPDEMKKIREIAPIMTFLVPGIGAQGGDLENTLKNGLRHDKKGLILSVSRGILYATNPREKAHEIRGRINTFR